MKVKPCPSQNELKAVFRYDADKGHLYWRERTPDAFADGAYGSARACAAWNAKFAGKRAFTSQCKGYYSGTLNGQKWSAHRLIWMLVHGYDPDFIDHINGDRADNRLANLRSASRTENNQNRCALSNNTSGVNGVGWDRAYQKWVGRLTSPDGRRRTHYSHCFGRAVAFRKQMEVDHGYHPNHGRVSV